MDTTNMCEHRQGIDDGVPEARIVDVERQGFIHKASLDVRL